MTLSPVAWLVGGTWISQDSINVRQDVLPGHYLSTTLIFQQAELTLRPPDETLSRPIKGG